jgi:hypothetical protein
MAVGTMDKPTGPTGILKSGQKGTKQGGRRTLGGSKGITSTPMTKTLGRKIGGGR